jgi:transposase-like protein
MLKKRRIRRRWEVVEKIRIVAQTRVTGVSVLATSLASEVKSQALLIEKLRHQLAGMRQHQFGSRSES